MTLKIQPYQFMSLKEIIGDLIRTYRSVSDFRTIEAAQAIAIEQVHQVVPDSSEELDDLIHFMMNSHLKKSFAGEYLETFKKNVIPFARPTKKQVEKVFRKTKKIKVPNFDMLDLREHTYIGWNDLATQRKFILYHLEDKPVGVSGEISTKVVKGFCSICHHEANVALFMVVSKRGSEGRYTKKGNYICVDSDRCNQQLCRREDLDNFLEHLK